jgi:hypothetical protein
MIKSERIAQPLMFGTPTAGMLPVGTLERLRSRQRHVEEPLAPKRVTERYTRHDRYAPPHQPISFK